MEYATDSDMNRYKNDPIFQEEVDRITEITIAQAWTITDLLSCARCACTLKQERMELRE